MLTIFASILFAFIEEWIYIGLCSAIQKCFLLEILNLLIDSFQCSRKVETTDF